MTFSIPGRLPSLNDLIHAMNRSRYAGAGMKREAECRIAWAAMREKPIAGAFRMSVVWYEPNNRRDRDNVTSGAKFILDALQPYSRSHPHGIGIIPGDGPKHMPHAPEHTVLVDKSHPHIEVTLEEIA